MLEKISWGDYWSTIAIAVAIYEILIILLFFRKDSLQLAGKISKGRFKVNALQKSQQQNLFPTDTENYNTSVSETAEHEIMMPQIHDLMQSLKSFISDVAERSFIKEEVIMGLQIILRDQKNLISTVFQKSINDFIAVECENKCSIHFSADDLKILWFG